jgi:hypothetical protein
VVSWEGDPVSGGGSSGLPELYSARKGLFTGKKVVEHGEKQRTLKT